MRLTIDISRPVHAQVKALSRQVHLPMSAIVEAALVWGLGTHPHPGADPPELAKWDLFDNAGQGDAGGLHDAGRHDAGGQGGSARMTIDLPARLHERIQAIAKAAHLSRSAVIVALTTRGLATYPDPAAPPWEAAKCGLFPDLDLGSR
jgi:hypothetical protein